MQVPPANDGESSDASGDASASIATGDAASTNGIHEGSAEAGMYCVGGMNGYATHGYVYDYSHGGLCGLTRSSLVPNVAIPLSM